jgi:hypothetical protein
VAYEVVTIGSAERTVWLELSDSLGPHAIRAEGGKLALSIPDQSALVSLLGRLNDLNIAVESVRQTNS